MKQGFFGIALLSLAATFGSGGASAAETCAPAGKQNFVCGPASAEDLVLVPGTHWIVGSGMTEGQTPGRLHLIDGDKKSWEVFYPGAAPKAEQDTKTYPICQGAPDPKTFGAHGIAIRDDGHKKSTLLAVNHGREAIEVFNLDAKAGRPEITWVGCVPMGPGMFMNSVAFVPGGGFAVTKFFDPTAPEGFGAVFARKITGGVIEWHPETGRKPLEGTEVSGANGIEVSKDGKWIYIAAWGTHDLVRFSRGAATLRKDVVPLGFSPDNLRWAPDGKLLVTGQAGVPSDNGGIPTFKGWKVVKVDPVSLAITEVASDDGASPMQNASVAIEVGDTLWVGPFRGDRIIYMKK